MIKVIGISGKINSGKDWSARVLQILLANPQLSNETVAILAENLKNNKFDSPWIIKAFGDKIKDVVTLLVGTERHLLTLHHGKDMEIHPIWNINENDKGKITNRDVIKKIGEGLKSALHPNTWIYALFRGKAWEERWIITDVRFMSELMYIQRVQAGIVIRINRKSNSSNHISEVDLDNCNDFNYVVENDGTQIELVQKLREILIKENILKKK